MATKRGKNGVVLCVPLGWPTNKWHGLMMMGHGGTRMYNLFLYIIHVTCANYVIFYCGKPSSLGLLGLRRTFGGDTTNGVSVEK